MTVLSLELNITRDWVSSFVMLCQAFTAADFSYCIICLLSLVPSSASETHTQSGWDQEIDLAISEYPTFLPSKTPGFWVIVHLYYEAPSNQLCYIWLNLGREYIPLHFRIHPADSVFCHVITKHQ